MEVKSQGEVGKKRCNLKFFHWVANGRRNRKYIKVLGKKEGALLDNIDNILEEILHFFKKAIHKSPWRVLEVRRFRLITYLNRECYLLGLPLYQRRDS